MKTEANDSVQVTFYSKGLTKREYFAAMALGDLTKYYDACGVGVVDVAQIAVSMADALIAELNKEQE